jgi:hypothetical protein
LSKDQIVNWVFVKGAKQPRKPVKSLEAKRNLAPLDLIHFDLCERNGLLKRGNRYFMTIIESFTLLAEI